MHKDFLRKQMLESLLALGYVSGQLAKRDDKIAHYPADNHAVKAHDDNRAYHRPASQAPSAFVCRRKAFVGIDRVFFAQLADRKLSQKDNKAHTQSQQQVNQHESRTAILSHKRGKFPRITKPHSRPSHSQHETDFRKF